MSREELLLEQMHAMLGGRAFLQGATLISRLAKRTGLHPVDVKLGLARLSLSGKVTGITNQGDTHQRVTVTVPAPLQEISPSEALWQSAMRRAGLGLTDMAALLACHEKIADFSSADMEALAAGLLALRAAARDEAGTPKFILSARYLLGSSKLLGQLPGVALTRFGIDLKAYPDAPPYVVTAGPAQPRAVVLVENPQAFDAAVGAGAAADVAFMVTFGYGLSRNSEDFGNQLLASVPYSDGLIPLVRQGQPPSPRSLLAHPRIFFWGDLDREGLRIYEGLRQRIPQLRLSALYAPMVQAMRRGLSHPYAKATAKDRQSPVQRTDTDAMWMLALCESRAMDQEYIAGMKINDLCWQGLDDVDSMELTAEVTVASKKH